MKETCHKCGKSTFSYPSFLSGKCNNGRLFFCFHFAWFWLYIIGKKDWLTATGQYIYQVPCTAFSATGRNSRKLYWFQSVLAECHSSCNPEKLLSGRLSFTETILTAGIPEGWYAGFPLFRISVKSAVGKSRFQSDTNEYYFFFGIFLMVVFGVKCQSLTFFLILSLQMIVVYFVSEDWGGLGKLNFMNAISITSTLLLKFPFTRKEQVMFWVPHNFFRASKQLALAGALKTTPKSWFY